MSTTKPDPQVPLAIVGLSCIFPQAGSLQEFWTNLKQGRDAISEIPSTHWAVDDYFDADPKSPDRTYARRGGFLSPVDFDPLEFGISPNNLEAIDTSQLLGLVAAKRALEDAGYPGDRTFDRSRVGCILGVTGTLELVIPLGARLGHPHWRRALREAGVAPDVAEDVVRRISESYVPWQENSFPGLLGNVVAGRIANRLDLGGTNCVVDAACASSLSALHLAALELSAGRSDMVLAGGVDTFNDIFMYMCFSKTPALSPSGNARPFDAAADGTILGEGVGMLVLKRLADAQRDGDRVYAVLRGIGTSSDGKGNAVYAPQAQGQVRALRDAYRAAGVTPDTIELVEAHGTGTKVGDATEIQGLTEVYSSTGRTGTWCALGSVKSQIGHTKAAAGVAGLIKATMALYHAVLPPTIKIERPQETLAAGRSPFYVNTSRRPWIARRAYPRRAAVSAFGFGGSNFHCVLEEPPARQALPDWDGTAEIASWTADSLAQLRRDVAAWQPPDEWNALRAAAAATRTAAAAGGPFRLHLVLERDRIPAAKVLSGAMAMLDKYPHKSSWSTPDGAYFGSGARAGKLGLLFPGQGSQSVNMLRDLACTFPQMRAILAEADEVFSADEPAGGLRLSDHIYPFPAFDDEERQACDVRLRATEIAQPAIGAVSLGALMVLDAFGVRPEAVAGHSYGELTALCASRRFSPAVLYRLSRLRGRLMAEGDGDRGSMLAVAAPAETVEQVLRDEALELVIANRNSPAQTVLSGATPEIERATEAFARREIRGKRLPVAAAFHSPLIAPAGDRFRPLLESVDFAPAEVPVFANTNAQEYPASPAAARDLLAYQLARPVEFVREIESMYASGVRTFVEVGPGATLTSLVGSILAQRDHRALAVDASAGRRSGVTDLAHVLAQLAALGHDVRLSQWNATADCQPPAPPRAAALTVPICGANYVKPRPRREPAVAVPAPAPIAAPAARATAAVDASPSQPAEPARTAAARTAPTRSAAPRPAAPAPRHDAEISTGSASPQMTVPAPSSDAVLSLQQNLLALQQMQEQAARLHHEFLEGQSAALRVFESLAARHGALSGSAAPLVVTARSAPQPLEAAAATRAPAETPPPAAVTQRPAAAPPAVSVPSPPRPAPTLPPVPAPAAPVAMAAAPPVAIPPVEPAPAAPPAATSEASSRVAGLLLEVVSEKTGYPTEMLELPMSLDGDLGIDSIKRVEILSALQDRLPELPPVKPDQLGTLHTLQDVVALLLAGAPADQPASAPAAAAAPAAPAPAPVAVPAPVVTSAQASGTATDDHLAAVLLEVVSEKTGYPVEMLGLEMGLDADLGIDSIKRVEILSALQERMPEAPAVGPEQLGTLVTLQDVVTLLGAAAPNAAPVAPAPVAPFAPTSAVAEAPAPVASTALAAVLLEVVAEKTGYPVEMLGLEMGLDADLGIDSIKRVEILSALQERMPDAPAVGPEQLGTLVTLQDVVNLLAAGSAVAPVAPVLAPVAAIAPAASGTTSGPVSAPRTGALASVLLEVVAEKTGYPVEMLGLEMGLDADLGIDSIKRVEILSALQERMPEAPAVGPEQLGTLVTLQDVVNLLAADAAPAALPDPAPRGPVSSEPVPSEPLACAPIAGVVRSIVQSGPPLPEGRPALRLPAGAEIRVTAQGGALSRQIVAQLERRGYRAALLGPDEPAPSLSGLIVVAPEAGSTDADLAAAFRTLRAAGPALRAAGTGALVATVSRMDGQFGLGAGTLVDPLSGGLAGLAKTARHEWPEVHARALDISADWPTPAAAAEAIVAELLVEGPVEIGLSPDGARGVDVSLASEAFTGTSPLAPGDVVVVSGGARGVTAEAAVALARACRPTLVLLGRSPEPVDEPDWLTGLTAEADIKRALLSRAQRPLTPRALEDEYRAVVASREVLETLARVEAAGAEAVYRSVDVRDAVAVRRLLDELATVWGPVRGIVHGAGVIADQRIENKTDDQFARVYSTKVDGLRSLLAAVDPAQLRVLALFSSFTGRYGRTGQVDYAVANEVLNKLAQAHARRAPACRVVSFNWGPWDGGMVHDALRKLFAAEGVGLIPLEAGAQTLVAELARPAGAGVERVVMGRLEAADDDAPPAAPVTEPRLAEFRTTFERELELERYPFLRSHVIDGHAVLPVAIILEWLSHAALHGNPGLELAGLDRLQVYKGIRLATDARYTLRGLASKPQKRDGVYVVPVRLVGLHGDREILHAGAEVVLTAETPSAPSPALLDPLPPAPGSLDALYETVLFHGGDFRGIEQIEGLGERGIAARVQAAPAPGAWIQEPLRGTWLADPLVLDCAFQLMIVWSTRQMGLPSLPTGLGRYRQFRRPFPREGGRIVIAVTRSTPLQATANIEYIDREGRLVARIDDYECVLDASLAASFRRNTLPEEVGTAG